MNIWFRVQCIKYGGQEGVSSYHNSRMRGWQGIVEKAFSESWTISNIKSRKNGILRSSAWINEAFLSKAFF